MIFSLLLPLLGCGQFSKPKDPKAQGTADFFDALQDIDVRRFSDIQEMLDEVVIASLRSDWDTAVKRLRELREMHEAAARQLRGLSHENVDGKALAFRDQLVSSHQSMADGCKRFAVGISEVKKTEGALFAKRFEEHVELWESGKEIMNDLAVKYDSDFRQ